MRIISGKLRRRRLLTNPGSTTRPYTDRVRTMIFDLLQWQIKERRIADIFSGTGTMGFECLSRGASSAVFIEQDHRAHDLLLKNAEALGLIEQSLCWRADVFRCSFKPKGDRVWAPYHLIFFDPPYEMAKDIQPGHPLFRAVYRLSRPDLLTDDGLMILRTPEHCQFTLPDSWEVKHRLDVSGMVIQFLARRSDAVFPALTTDSEDVPEANPAEPAPATGASPE
jgi:16S rRNA (guanine966-N2)-methyltransferase